jgi:hypothetical protein
VTPYVDKYLGIVSRAQRMLCVGLRGVRLMQEQKMCFPGKQVPLHIDEEMVSRT